jgi:hypothetical protein
MVRPAAELLWRVPRNAVSLLFIREPSSCMYMLWSRILRKYSYAIRVDEDVCITRVPARAIFAALAADYDFGLETVESHLETVQTFNPWVHDYMVAMGLQPKLPPLPTVRYGSQRVAYFHQFLCRSHTLLGAV